MRRMMFLGPVVLACSALLSAAEPVKLVAGFEFNEMSAELGRRHHIGRPYGSPPDYAAVFWDQHFAKRTDPSEVKFCRVPNP